MLKMLLAGAWGVAMAVAGIYAEMALSAQQEAAADHGAALPAVEQVTADLTGVPVVMAGKVEGYLVFRLRSTIDRGRMKHGELDVTPYLLDAAFRACYEYAARGVERVRPQDVETITARIAALTNAKLGPEVVEAVNLEQFNFVSASEVRGNLFQVH